MPEGKDVIMETKDKIKKRKGLDALRGIGITGIVLYHMFPSVFRGGFLGVPLFFVLSGYLMFMTSEKCWQNGDFHILSYYKKRIRKIIPPLFIMLMAVCCYLTLAQRSQMAGIRQELTSIFLGYNNWWQIQQNTSYFSKLAAGSPFTHLWFLSVEMQFYLLWPILFLLYQKACRIFSGKKMCFVFLLLALLSAGSMSFLYTPGTDPSRVYYGTDTMAFPLLIGIFLGALRQQYNNLVFHIGRKQFIALSGAFALITCLLFVLIEGKRSFLYLGGMLFISLFYAAMILIIENGETANGNLPGSTFLSLLGEKSYPIYLWHYPIIYLTLTYI